MSKFKKKNLEIQLDEKGNKGFINYLSTKQILIDRDSLRFRSQP